MATKGLVHSSGWVVLAVVLGSGAARAETLKILKTGLGGGTLSSPSFTACAAGCDLVNQTYTSGTSVQITVTADGSSTFAGWEADPDRDTTTTADCTGATNPCTVVLTANRSLRPRFNLNSLPTLTSLDPAAIHTFLTVTDSAGIVNSPGRFLAALPGAFKDNWLLMSRSESLQPGTAKAPRILLTSANAQNVFSIALEQSPSYPVAHENAVEYMQWDPIEKNFRFHEIVVQTISTARPRGVSIDDHRCSKCHSTRNVLNRDSVTGTTGVAPNTRLLKAKNKPNWDTYDSWSGLLPFNRDRIYQGSLEAAAFRKLFNPWTWEANRVGREVMEQLRLQPAGVVSNDRITRRQGGTNDGHVNFAFDAAPPVLIEPAPVGDTTLTTNYEFNAAAGTGTATTVQVGGDNTKYVTLRHTDDITGTSTAIEGRGVQFFDYLSGADVGPPLNPMRVADEIIDHRYATGSVPIDVRAVTLAIMRLDPCLLIDTTSNTVITKTETPPLPALTVDQSFFTARHGGMGINQVVADTRARAESMPRRKADFQKRNLDRLGDTYTLFTSPENGLIPVYGGATTAGTSASLDRLRQEVFRRPIDLGFPDATVMGGIYVDRELYSSNTNKVALLRYFLEPLGVSVDKWSMGVRGRSRTYSFADIFPAYQNTIDPQLTTSLGADAASCTTLINKINTDLGSLPLPTAIPTYTDIQRIFNKACIECHGGLGYPPYRNYGTVLDVSEQENPTVGDRSTRSYDLVTSSFTTTDPATSRIYIRVTRTTEDCPSGLMPCGGPPLSKVDIETIRRWILGSTLTGSRPATRGDPHIETIEGIHYDFQAAGEYVLLRDPGFELQARQTAVTTAGPLGPNEYTGLTSCVSINTAVALRVGQHRISYQPSVALKERAPSALELRIDGKVTPIGTSEILLANGGRIVPTSAPGGIQVEAPGGTVVIITPAFWDYYQVWYMNIDLRSARAVDGLMGAIPSGNWLPALPDGSFLGPRPESLAKRYEDLYGRFGKAWRVTDATALFDYPAGVTTASFTLESWPEGESPASCVVPQGAPGDTGKPAPAALTPAVAAQHCQGVRDEDVRASCVQDVAATGEPGFARVYLAADAIQNNIPPPPPTLGFPAEWAVDVVAPVTFTWTTGADPDGDPTTYRHCLWDVHEPFTFAHCDPPPAAGSSDGPLCTILKILIGLCALAVVILLVQKRTRAALVSLLLLAGVVALFALRCCGAGGSGAGSMSKQVTGLQSGKAYYWKVIADDGRGATVQSESRRFQIK